MDRTEKGTRHSDVADRSLIASPPSPERSSNGTSTEFPRPLSETKELGKLVPPEQRELYITCSSSETSTSEAPAVTVTDTVQEPQAEPVSTPRLFSPSLFRRDLREAIEFGQSTLSAGLSKLGLRESAGTFLAKTVALCGVAYFGHNPIEGLGIGAIAVWTVAVCCQLNRHGRALGILGLCFYVPHMWANGHDDVAICGLAGGARLLLQAMVPDERPVARGMIAALGFAATAGVCAFSNGLNPLLSMQNIPLITLGLSCITGAFTDRLSWVARLTTLSNVSMSLMYHVAVTGSHTGVVANSLFTLVGLWSVWRYDIAKRSEPVPAS